MHVVAAAGPSAYWYLTRGTGTVSLVLLTMSVVLGVLDAERFAAPAWPRFVVDRLHRDASLLAMALLAIHIVTSVLDAFAPITLLDAVIPFTSAYRPLWLGLGAVGCDLLIAVLVTSLLRRRLGYRRWRAIHWLAYASWPVAVFHSLGTGSDAGGVWLVAVTVACLAAVLAAVAARALRARHGSAGARGGALVATVILPIGLAVFAIRGPFAAHWAARAGTPARILHASVAPRRARAPGRPSAAVAPARDNIPASFTDSLDGSVIQTTAPGGALVDLNLRCSGTLRGVMRVRLAGSPVPGGGLSLTGSEVQLTAPGLTQALQGSVATLSGQSFAARVRNRAGTALDLRADLSIDNATNTVTGTLVATRTR